MRITCDRCGRDRMLSETHATAAQRDLPISDIIARMRHGGYGGRAGGKGMATYWKKFAAGIATASVLMLGACDLSAYPCRGPYGEPCGGPRSGWPGAVTCPSC
jgi:hypothetical protein